MRLEWTHKYKEGKVVIGGVRGWCWLGVLAGSAVKIYFFVSHLRLHGNPMAWRASCPQWAYPQGESSPGCLVCYVLIVPLPCSTGAFRDSLPKSPRPRRPVCLSGWFVFSILTLAVVGGASSSLLWICPLASPSCSHSQPGLSLLRVLATVHPPWDNDDDCSNTDLALFLPLFTSSPCPPTALRVTSIPCLPLKGLYKLSQPSLSCPPAFPSSFSSFDTVARRFKGLQECLKTGKAI